jgi:hypothetical protein
MATEKRKKGQTVLYKTLYRNTLLKIGGEFRCSGKVSSSCFTCVTLVTKLVISHE